jgi:hypothetical protein
LSFIVASLEPRVNGIAEVAAFGPVLMGERLRLAGAGLDAGTPMPVFGGVS